MCSLSALGRVVNSGEGVKGGGWPIQEMVAKEVTVEVRGYLLGAFAPMTLVPIVVGREARSERVASSARKRESGVRSLLLSPVRDVLGSGHLEVLVHDLRKFSMSVSLYV
jgi:hypothetical protein